MPCFDRKSLVYLVVNTAIGPYTLQGTCTYLVGKGKSRFLVDTGSGGHGYVEYLRQALTQESCALQGIVVTHWHHDHIGGIPDIQRELGVEKEIPVYKYMPAECEKLEGKGEASIDPYEIWPKEKVSGDVLDVLVEIRRSY